MISRNVEFVGLISAQSAVFKVVRRAVIVEEVTHTTGEPWNWCADYKHSFRVWCGLDVCYATTGIRLSSWQSSNASTTETLGIHSATSARFDGLQWLHCVTSWCLLFCTGT